MDNRIEFKFLRVLKGRISYMDCGLSLYIQDPNQDMMYDSIEIYDRYFDEAYGSGVFTSKEMDDYLIDKELYSPFDDQDIDKLQKDMDELKVQAYKNHYKKRELGGIKYLIKSTEQKINSIRYKKLKYEPLTCEGIANLCRWNWIIENSTYNKDNTKYEFKDISLANMVSYYDKNNLTQEEYRAIARYEGWRTIWSIGKKTGNMFAQPIYNLTKDQLLLCSFSTMYDAVYENPECPNDTVIQDDYCLDGWFIEQRRKSEKEKSQQQASALISNSKIANSNEVFVVANDVNDVKNIHSMNTVQSENIRKQRMDKISQDGVVDTDLKFRDVMVDMQMRQNRAMSDHVKGK